jgi:hypothetical protein
VRDGKGIGSGFFGWFFLSLDLWAVRMRSQAAANGTATDGKLAGADTGAEYSVGSAGLSI